MIRTDINFLNYLDFASNKNTLFYSENNSKNNNEKYTLPKYDKSDWVVYVDRYWHYFMNKFSDFPAQGWKIHISATINESQHLLYDVSNFLFKNNVSFKFVPSRFALMQKNSKYGDRAAAGKFITVYPSSEKNFCELLDELKEITDNYSAGPYILNDMCWKESNIYFRYGGLKRIERKIDGEKKLVILDNNGNYVEDKRVPYYYLPEFVKEPEYVAKNNYFPNKKIFKKIPNLNILGSIHFSNSGGVYLIKTNKKRYVMKEGRPECGIDSKNNDGFSRLKNEYYSLKKLADVDAVVNVDNYFVEWINNYFIEEYIEGQSLQDFIAQEYPFNNDKKSNHQRKYLIKAKKIILQLKSALEKVHEYGIAIGDLSLSNVMITKDNKIKLIDFEVSEPIYNTYQPSLATPNYYSSKVNNYLKADWFAFHRIIRKIFIPIIPVLDMAPDIISIQNKLIKTKFGTSAFNFLEEIENFVKTKVDIYPKSEYLEQKLSIPEKMLSEESINYYINSLTKGLLDNIDNKTLSLVHGDIYQYIDDFGYYNIANGSFGVILALIRADSSLKYMFIDKNSKWLFTTVAYIEKLVLNEDTSIGLFDGISGVVTALYELGLKEEALYILKNIKFDNINDISIYSGLSGIGLLFLSFYSNLNDTYFLEKAVKIADIIKKILNKNMSNLSDFGFLSGWSGAALFLWKVSLFTNDNKYRKLVKFIINKAIHSLSKPDNLDKNVYVLETSRGIPRYVPYLENGTAGLGLVLLEINKDKKSFLSEKDLLLLNNICSTNDAFCSFNCGLIQGYSGLLPLANAVTAISGKRDQLNRLLQSLNMYIVKDNSGNLLVPGRLGYKCSMDVSTGAAGVLMNLCDTRSKDKWNSWFPVLGDKFKLFQKC
ncbi:MAG: class III lanthionine synthetase LanKC [Lactobacillus sp.]|nr:class III lanthionine synthetase LanKC [Lactobacillus sp.]